MELLNGLTKQAFEKWIDQNYNGSANSLFHITFGGITSIPFEMLQEGLQHALIIEFFDSAGVYIEPQARTYGAKGFTYYINCETPKYGAIFLARSEAIKQAIIQSSQIYNLKHSHELFS